MGIACLILEEAVVFHFPAWLYHCVVLSAMDVWSSDLILSGEARSLTPFSHPLSAVAHLGDSNVRLSRTMPLKCVEGPFLVSALFFLFYFGIWVWSSLPIPYFTTSLLNGDRSRTSFLSRLSRLRKWHETNRIIHLFLENTSLAVHLFSLEKLTWKLFNVFSLVGLFMCNVWTS